MRPRLFLLVWNVCCTQRAVLAMDHPHDLSKLKKQSIDCFVMPSKCIMTGKVASVTSDTSSWTAQAKLLPVPI